MTLDIQIHSSLAVELKRHPRSLTTILCDRGEPYRIDKLRSILKKFVDGHGVKVVPDGLRKNAVNALLEAGCTAAQTSAVSGQSLQMVEHYARRRNRTKLGAAAILNWERDQNENRKKIGK